MANVNMCKSMCVTHYIAISLTDLRRGSCQVYYLFRIFLLYRPGTFCLVTQGFVFLILLEISKINAKLLINSLLGQLLKS